ncbi:transmembrane protein [Cystoisospora suis]|uniref:Transmembrane protein n=1 Tax=Cystoisospora suis TaxID=483139 RepID=A0A2C6KTL6_9APIC|nr:transmembrane protein [Cystoisospora suis]
MRAIIRASSFRHGGTAVDLAFCFICLHVFLVHIAGSVELSRLLGGGPSYPSLEDAVAAVLRDTGGLALTVQGDREGLENLLARYEETHAALAARPTNYNAPENVAEIATKLVSEGRWRISYPRVQQVLDDLTKGFVELRTGVSRPWWFQYADQDKGAPPQFAFGGKTHRWSSCLRTNLPGSSRPFHAVLDDLQLQSQLLVEAVLVGLFGICGPYFLRKKTNRPFDCVSDENQDILFAQYYLPTAVARNAKPFDDDAFDLNCPENFSPKGTPGSMLRAWRAMAAFMEDRYPEGERLTYSPVIPEHSQSFAKGLFEIVADWSQYKNGTVLQSDVGAALAVSQEFVQVLRAFLRVTQERSRHVPSDMQSGPQGILGLFDEFEFVFCASTAGASDWRGTAKAYPTRTQLANGLLQGRLGDRFLVSHSFGVIALDVLEFLSSLSGSPTSPEPAWSKVQALVAHRPVPDGNAYRSGTQRVSRFINVLIRRYITPLPLALRATVVALVGLWAAEWEEPRTSAGQEQTNSPSDSVFSFDQPGGRAEKLFFLMALLGARSPAQAAAEAVVAWFNGQGWLSLANRNGIDAKLPQLHTLPVGRIVYIGSEGETSWNADPEQVGFTSGSLKIKLKPVTEVFELIAASSPNVLAPLGAADALFKTLTFFGTTLMNRESLDKEDLTFDLAQLLAASEFGLRCHCATAKRAVAKLLSESETNLSERDLDALLQELVVEVSYGDSKRPPGETADGKLSSVRLRCSFSMDQVERRQLLESILSVRPRRESRTGGIVSRIKRFVGSAATNQRSSVIPAEIRRAQKPGEWQVDGLSALQIPPSYAEYVFSLLHELPRMQRPYDLHRFYRIGGRDLLLATDVDDTAISSGGWRLKGPGGYLGGADTAYPRGRSYPGVGSLYFLLTLGRDRRRAGGPGLGFGDSPRVLPIILLTARVDSKILRPFFRPRYLYAHLASIVDYGMALITKSPNIADNQVVLENPQPLSSAVRGKVQRGLNKVRGIENLVKQAKDGNPGPGLLRSPTSKFMFSGDTFEKDLEVCIFLSISEPAHFVACMMHIAFDSSTRPGADPGAVPSTFGAGPFSRFEQLPEEVLLFNLSRYPSDYENAPKVFTEARGEFSGAVGAAVRYVIEIPGGDKSGLRGRDQGDCDTVPKTFLWNLAEQVSARVKRILNVFRFTWKRDGLETLVDVESCVPLIFLSCSHVEVNTAIKRPRVRFLAAQEPGRDGRTQVDASGYVVPERLGLPIMSYRTIVGAATHARFLNLIDSQDLAALNVAVLRQQRSLGPPAVLSRNTQWRDLMADLYMQHMLFGGSPPAVLLDMYSLTVGSSLSPAVGRRLKHVTCRVRANQSFSSFSELLKSLFPNSEYEGAVASASETWNRVTHLFCVHEEQFLHLCSAGQAELEYLAHAVAELNIFESESDHPDHHDVCYHTSGKGAAGKGANMPVFLSFLFRLCLVNLRPCLSAVNLLQDVRKLALWRRAETSQHLNGEGIFLAAFDNVAYPTSDPDYKFAARHYLPRVIRPLIQRPAGKQSTWPQTYKHQRWVRTATAWSRLDACLLTPLQHFAQATIEKMRSSKGLLGQASFRLLATDPALAYLGTSVTNIEKLLYVVYAGDVRASLWSEAAGLEMSGRHGASEAAVGAAVDFATGRYITQIARIVSQRQRREEARSKAIQERFRAAEADAVLAMSPVRMSGRSLDQGGLPNKRRHADP